MKKKKEIFSILIGTAIDYYDNMLFMHFLFLLTPLFFPTSNPIMAGTLALGSFAACYIIRPIGGIVFGHFGDRLGRKKSLYFSILLMSFPTLIIGLLPTYEQIGIAAPVILISCRLAQNFFVGGEAAGGLVSLIEFSNPKYKGLVASILNIGAMLGGLLGTALGYLFTQPFMPEWGWRIPFLMGAVVGWLGLRMRLKFSETPAFKRAKQNSNLFKMPLVNLLMYQRLDLLRTMIMPAGFVAPYFMVFVYVSNIFKNDFHLQSFEVMKINSLIMLIWLLLFPTMGYLSDIVDRRKMIQMAALTIFIISYPLFFLVTENPTLLNYIFLQIVLSVAGTAIVGASAPLVASFYSTSLRYTGIAFGWSIGVAIFGASAPLISTQLVIWTGNKSAPSLFLMFCGVLSVISTLKSRINTDIPQLSKMST